MVEAEMLLLLEAETLLLEEDDDDDMASSRRDAADVVDGGARSLDRRRGLVLVLVGLFVMACRGKEDAPGEKA
jgi:hypothetical protein